MRAHSAPDNLSATSSLKRGISAWSCRHRLCVCAFVVAINTLLSSAILSGVLAFLALFLTIRTRPSWIRIRLFLLVPLWPTLLVAVGFSIGFGSILIGEIGPVRFYQEGIIQALTFFVRAYANILWIALVCATSSAGEVLAALDRLGVPRVLLDITAGMIRYGFLLSEEFFRMTLAAHSRGAKGGLFARFKMFGSVLAQIFLRAMDRAERIHVAQVARGKDENM